MKDSREKKTKSSRKRGFHKLLFGRMQVAMSLFLFIVCILVAERHNVSVKKSELRLDVLEQEAFQEPPFDKEPECLLLWDSQDEDAKNAGQEMMEILSQMRIAYEAQDIAQKQQFELRGYKKIVLAVNIYDKLGEQIFDLFDSVNNGLDLLVVCPAQIDQYYNLIYRYMGIRESSGEERYRVEGLRLKRDFMIGGLKKDFLISTPFNSSNNVILDDNCEVYLTSADEAEVPLIWKYTYGEGDVVSVNLNYFEKAYRGFYAAAYSLLSDSCVYPVINASSFYLDDFPSPVPYGSGEYIERDYGMSIETFYTNVWWPDMQELAEEHGIRYTGLVIENYSDEHATPLSGNTDTRRFQYFGNELLNMGGEIGFHGYNHMPLVLPNFYYGEEYESYRQWESPEDIRAAMAELNRFCRELYPDEKFQVYVPPSNILSDEGRAILAEDFLDIKAIASIYFEGQAEYTQDFRVAEDGIIETPRIISGCVIDSYMEIAALSELNFHFVNSHFLHPDDVLDEDRGAAMGWEAMRNRLSEYMDWLYTSAPEIRNLTGTEMAGAVQRYYYLDTLVEERDGEIHIRLSNFQDEAWLFARVNRGTVSQVVNGNATEVAEDLYLVQALDNEVILKLDYENE